jgi:hypothetical protein
MYNKNLKTNHSHRKKRIVSIFATLVLFGVTIFGYWLYSQRSGTDSVNIGSVSGPERLDLNPATDEEKQVGEDAKDKIVADMDASNSRPGTSSNSDKTKVTPFISAARVDGDSFKLNGYVPSVIETDGTCVATMTKDRITVTESRQAMQNAQNTTCGQIIIPKSKLESGTWQATLSYSSSRSAGTSEKVNVEVN